MVASAILADVEPGLPARRNRVAAKKTAGSFGRFTRTAFFPGGKMPLLRQAGMPAATFSDSLSNKSGKRKSGNSRSLLASAAARLIPNSEVERGACPPRARFSAPSRKTAGGRKCCKGSCQCRAQAAGREARPATPGAGVLTEFGNRVNPSSPPAFCAPWLA